MFAIFIKVTEKVIDTLNKNYENLRRVKGDGNCFYRAVGYGYIERVILMGEKALKELINLIECKKYPFGFGDESEVIVRILNQYFSIILSAVKKNIDSGLKELYKAIAIDPVFDYVVLKQN